MGVEKADPLRAELQLATDKVRAGEGLRYRIVNTGPDEFICGRGYDLQRDRSGGWTSINRDTFFIAIGLIVWPGEHRDLTAMIPAPLPRADTASVQPYPTTRAADSNWSGTSKSARRELAAHLNEVKRRTAAICSTAYLSSFFVL